MVQSKVKGGINSLRGVGGRQRESMKVQEMHYIVDVITLYH